MNQEVRFAVVGLGTITKKHLESIKNAKGAKLVALYSSSKEKATEWGKQFEVEAYNDYERMLQDPMIDAVVILTPSGLHAEYGIKAAKAGKHVVVEKPIDTTLEKAKQLVEACEKSKVKLSCIFQHRFDPGIEKLKEAILDNQLGDLNFGASRTTWYRSQEYYDSGAWRGTWELDGGGALMNQSIHYIDLLLYIMGPVEEVHAYTATRSHTNIEVEDMAVASIKFRSGAIGMIEGNTAAYPGFDATLDIFGTDGSARVKDDQLVEFHLKGNEDMNFSSSTTLSAEEQKGLSHQSFQKQYEDIADAILNDREPLINGEESLKALELIHAIYKSSRTGKPVKL